MRVNPDCARLIMLYLEENLTYSGSISSLALAEKTIFTSFKRDDVFYAVKQLYKEDYIECIEKKTIQNGNIYYIFDVQPKGHRFCELIRNEDEWNNTKPKFKDLSTFESITAILSNVATIATSIRL